MNQLPAAVQTICTLEPQDDSFVAQVDSLLTGNVDAETDMKYAYENLSKLTPEAFSTVCKASYQHNHYYKSFMLAGKHYIDENIEKFKLVDLSYVLMTFAFNESSYKILERASKIILENATKISVTE